MTRQGSMSSGRMRTRLYLRGERPSVQGVAIFDELWRAWTEQTGHATGSEPVRVRRVKFTKEVVCDGWVEVLSGGGQPDAPPAAELVLDTGQGSWSVLFHEDAGSPVLRRLHDDPDADLVREHQSMGGYALRAVLGPLSGAEQLVAGLVRANKLAHLGALGDGARDRRIRWLYSMNLVLPGGPWQCPELPVEITPLSGMNNGDNRIILSRLQFSLEGKSVEARFCFDQPVAGGGSGSGRRSPTD